jgi:hypothetical protein
VLAPETANPLPATVTELIVTGVFPEAVSVTCCEAIVFTFTFPNARLVVLALRSATAASSSRSTDCETPPALAVSRAL